MHEHTNENILMIHIDTLSKCYNIENDKYFFKQFFLCRMLLKHGPFETGIRKLKRNIRV